MTASYKLCSVDNHIFRHNLGAYWFLSVQFTQHPQMDTFFGHQVFHI